VLRVALATGGGKGVYSRTPALVRHTRIVYPSDKLSNCVARYIPLTWSISYYNDQEKNKVPLTIGVDPIPKGKKVQRRSAFPIESNDSMV
jgi:hypothetical protein